MIEPKVNRQYKFLAPAVAFATWRGLEAARAAGHDVALFEGFRSKERQSFLYAKGRTSPGKIVTRATPEKSWHCYGLAVDIVFRTASGGWTWPDNEALWADLAVHFTGNGLFWGGNWQTFKDRPHFQFAALPTTPGSGHISLFQKNGPIAVWEFFGAHTLSMLDKSVHAST